MAVMMGNDPIVIPSAEGERLVPSVVAINKNGERIVGRPARNQAIINAQNTVFSVKRFMGRKFNDVMVQKTAHRVPYKVEAAENGDVRVLMNNRNYAPPEISAMILTKMKRDAEAYLGESINKAVITVPAYFNDAQRNATKDAGKIAGLDVLRIINEPTASSLAYGLDKSKNETIMVFDLGGGTLDVSILEVGEGVFEVIATSGDTFLGGDDFDQRIMEHLVEVFHQETRINLSKDRQALQRLKEASEKAKIELSSIMQTEISLPYISADANGPKHLNLSLTRSKLEQLTADLLERSLLPVHRSLEDAKLRPENIQEVVLVGGMTRMPAIQETVRRLFGREPHRGVNPDEVVAIGAAIQAGVLGGEVQDVLLLDVTPLTLSIETMGGIATPLIARNTTIPTRRGEVFSTATDNQPQVEIHVVQGERSMAADNKSLGKFILDGIPPAPRGIPQIQVTFDINANGILGVTAMDKSTGREQSITLTASSGLSAEEISKMQEDAQIHASEDRRRRENIDLLNQANNSIYQAEKKLNEFWHKIPDALKDEILNDIHKLKTSLSVNNFEGIRINYDSLQQSIQKIGSSTHKQAPSEQQIRPGPTRVTKPFFGKDIVDGDVKE